MIGNTMYRAEVHDGKIESHGIIRMSDSGKTIWRVWGGHKDPKGRPELVNQIDAHWFDTYSEAISWLADQLERRAATRKSRGKRAKKLYKQAKKLRDAHLKRYNIERVRL